MHSAQNRASTKREEQNPVVIILYSALFEKAQLLAGLGSPLCAFSKQTQFSTDGRKLYKDCFAAIHLTRTHNMMQKLKPTDYAKVRPLFQGAYLTLIIDGVLAGNSTGKLWVDDANQPRTALLWDNAYILYVAGAVDNKAFNHQLGELFINHIAPTARAHGIDGFKIVYSHPDWENQMEVVLPTMPLTRYPRVVYTWGEGTIADWQSQLPPNYAMRPIDQALLADPTLGNLADLIEEIELCWPSRERFLSHGFGLCLVGNGEIVCRCTAEYVSANKCGIGIATAEHYRQRGFATLTASALLEECLRRQITPYWDAWLNNTASVATAERVGLRKVQDHWVFVGPLG
jgi:RimJ/RimL family protein N-acetyltransferase